jgi:hypothetical protein
MSSIRKRRRTGIRKPIAGASELCREIFAARRQDEEQRGQAIIQYGRLLHKAQRTGELQAAYTTAGLSRRQAYNYIKIYLLHRESGISAREIGTTDLSKLLAIAGRDDKAGKSKWLRAANQQKASEFVDYAGDPASRPR